MPCVLYSRARGNGLACGTRIVPGNSSNPVGPALFRPSRNRLLEPASNRPKHSPGEPSGGQPLFHSPNDLGWLHSQDRRKPNDGTYRRTLQPSFDQTNVGAVKTAFQRQRFLRDSFFLANLAQRITEGLHGAVAGLKLSLASSRQLNMLALDRLKSYRL